MDSVQEIKDTFMQCAEAEGFELFEIPKHSDLKQVSCCYKMKYLENNLFYLFFKDIPVFDIYAHN